MGGVVIAENKPVMNWVHQGPWHDVKHRLMCLGILWAPISWQLPKKTLKSIESLVHFKSIESFPSDFSQGVCGSLAQEMDRSVDTTMAFPSLLSRLAATASTARDAATARDSPTGSKDTLPSQGPTEEALFG